MKETIQELADTTSTSNRGTSRTAYNLEPTIWLRDIIDAAKKMHFFMDVCTVGKVTPGNKDIIFPYRSMYLKNSGTFSDQTAEGSAVSFTTMDNLDGKQLTPSIHAYGVAISEYALRVNAVNLLQAAKEELIYNAGDVVDQAIAAALRAAGTATSSARGAQELFGGDASTCITLEAGDILDTDLVAEGIRRLEDTACRYWSGGSEGVSSASKNGWFNTAAEPFVLFIASPQKTAFLKDSQFVNAAEYGSQEVLLNGEVGKYLGVKIVVTPNTPKSGDGDYCLDTSWGSGTDLAGHMCLMVKSKKCAVFAWGLEPDLKVFEYPRELEMDLILAMDYAVSAFYTDAVVKIYVLDN